MNRRLQQFLGAENISQSQFADSIGVARASVSHILAGRNKPGFDFILNMAKAYPALNVDWLITGKGRMYKTSNEPIPVQSTNYDELPDLFGEESEAVLEQTSDSLRPVPEEVRTPSNASASSTQRRDTAAGTSSNTDTIALVGSLQQSAKQRNISKIVIFYDDNTYQELK